MCEQGIGVQRHVEAVPPCAPDRQDCNRVHMCIRDLTHGGFVPDHNNTDSSAFISSYKFCVHESVEDRGKDPRKSLGTVNVVRSKPDYDRSIGWATRTMSVCPWSSSRLQNQVNAPVFELVVGVGELLHCFHHRAERRPLFRSQSLSAEASMDADLPQCSYQFRSKLVGSAKIVQPE